MWLDAGEEIFVCYLLGELSASDRDRFEADYFVDDSIHEQLLAIECELIDAYVRGDLSPSQHRDFEAHYLSTAEGRERVASSRALAEYQRTAPAARTNLSLEVGAVPIAAVVPASGAESIESRFPFREPETQRWWQNLLTLLRAQTPVVKFALGTAVLLIIVISWATVVRTSRLRLGSQQLTTKRDSSPTVPPSGQVAANEKQGSEESGQAKQSATRNAEQLAKQIEAEQAKVQQQIRNEITGVKKEGEQNTANLNAKPSDNNSPVTVAALILPGLRSAGGGNIVQLPKGTKELRLRLSRDPLDSSSYSSYRVKLQTPEGRQILSREITGAGTGYQIGRGYLNGATAPQQIEITVPSNLLPSGDYVAILAGVDQAGKTEDLGGYSFSVTSEAKTQTRGYLDSVRIRVTPGSELFADGNPVLRGLTGGPGETYLILDLKPGMHIFRVRKGRQAIVKTVSIVDGQNLEIDLRLAAALIPVEIKRSPLDSSVTYTRPTDPTAQTFTGNHQELPEGDYTFVARAKGYLETVQQIHISSNFAGPLDLTQSPINQAASQSYTMADWGHGAWTQTDGWYTRKSGGIIFFPKPLGTGTVEFAIHWQGKGRALWILNASDASYVQCELDDSGFQMFRVVDGKKQAAIGKKKPVTKRASYGIRIEIQPDGVTHKLQTDSGWETLDSFSGTAPTGGKFGFDITDGQELFLANFSLRPGR